MRAPFCSTTVRAMATAVLVALGAACSAVGELAITSSWISGEHVWVQWNTPTNRFIIESMRTPGSGLLCRGSSTGSAAAQAVVALSTDTSLFFRVRTGLQALSFPEEGLAQSVRRSLPEPKTEPTNEVYDCEVTNLAWLIAGVSGISNLTGIAQLGALTNADLQGNPLRDASALQVLSNLWTLILNYCPVTNLPPLGGVRWLELYQCGLTNLALLKGPTNLAYLQIGQNAITSLAPIATAHALETLEMAFNNVSDLSPLAGTTNLRTLVCLHNGIADLTPLAGLHRLEEIVGTENPITNLAPLAGLTDLTYASFQACAIRDVSPLAGLTNLAYLEFTENAVTNIAAMSNLTRLTHLNLGGNPVKDISPLRGLTGLTELMMALDPITNDLHAIAGLTNLETLSIYWNNFGSIAALSNMPRLRTLAADFNGLSDIAPIGRATGMWTLTVNHNSISNIDVCTNFPRVRNLSIADNAITSLAPLAGCSILVDFEAYDNLITDLTPLTWLSNMDRVALQDNLITDLGPLVTNAANGGLKGGDVVGLTGNPLSIFAQTNQLPLLTNVYGVTVIWTP